MRRNMIRDSIVPPTRVRHALARVFFCRGPMTAAAAVIAAASLLLSGAPRAGGDVELAIGLGKPGAAHHDDAPILPGDQAAMARFDFEGSVLYHPGQRIKDHAVVLEDGVFHVFYISDLDRSFGHATSTDLRRWEIHPPVLTRGPDEWDNRYIWAPCVRRLEGTGSYLMYYTGVNPFASQSCGLAISTGDLWSWYKTPKEMIRPFGCDPSWCQWDYYAWSHFRDPFFFEDGGKHYITNTARAGNGNGAIALSESDGYYDWSDAGPLYVHNSSRLLESSQVIRHNGKYHLFFTEEDVGGTSHMSSDSLRSGWDINFRIYIDSGHAPEITALPSGDTIFSRHTSYLDYTGAYVNMIRFDTLLWSDNRPAIYREPPLSSEWTKLWGTAFVRQPVFGDAYAFRGDTTTVGFEGNWWIGTAEAFNGPLFGYRPGAYQGDEPRGAIRSRVFTVTGRSMSLLVGGGAWPDSCWVALHLAEDGSIIRRETGRGVERMDRRVWDLEPYIGRQVYIEIVDDCASAMGHINVDSIRESPFPFAVESAGNGLSSPGFACGDSPSPVPPSPAPAEGTGPAPPAPGREVVCNPNPCNPSTVITFSGCTSRAAQVVIFSVSGRRIFSAEAPVGADGTGAFFWEGRSADGRAVASGVYAAAVFDGPALVGVSKLVVLR
ncbi:MAG: family 43 glycosylhydrolase [Candidatus Krumholzibacteria bacterium]|nr:family 43 glycosylhydrolase [Candidatus Krumholzibacteria bacterium]